MCPCSFLARGTAGVSQVPVFHLRFSTARGPGKNCYVTLAIRFEPAVQESIEGPRKSLTKFFSCAGQGGNEILGKREKLHLF